MRDRESIRSLFEKIGHSFKAGKFNTLYNKAKEVSQSTDDRVSVRGFLQAIQIYADLDWEVWEKGKKIDEVKRLVNEGYKRKVTLY